MTAKKNTGAKAPTKAELAKSEAEEVKAEEVETQEVEAEEAETKEAEAKEVIAVALSVKVINKYPHESYGRCGRRFTKQEIEVDIDKLSEEEINVLTDDPWLETHVITAE